MADRNHLRLADSSDIPNDDPFAELTRIMGFDPRLPGASQLPIPPKLSLDDDGFDEADFSIDLEKELMGELSSEFDAEPLQARVEPIAPSVEPAASSVEPVADEPVPTGGDADVAFDQEWFSAEEEAAVSAVAPVEAVAEETFVAEPVDAPEVYDFTVETDEEPVAEAEFAAEPQLTDFEEVRAAEPPHIEPIFADVPQAEPHFDDEDVWVDTLDVPVEPQAYVEPQFGDIETHAAADEVQGEPVALVDNEADLDDLFDEALSDAVHVPEPEPQAADISVQADESPEQDIDHELELQLAPEAFEPVEEPAAAVTPISAALVDQDLGTDLEDELNALLGNAPAAPVAAAAAPLASAVIKKFAPRSTIFDIPTTPRSYATPVAPRPEPVAAFVPQPVAQAPVWEDQGRPSFVGPVVDEVEAASDDDLTAIEDDFELDFDEQAFHAAMSDSLDEDEAAVGYAADEPAEIAEDDTPETYAARDPYSAISALSAAIPPVRPVAYDPEDELPTVRAPIMHDSYVPDIDTIDVHEQAVALADDLDLPEFVYEEDAVKAPAYDDIDAEFNSLLHDMNVSEQDAVPAPSHDAYDDDFGNRRDKRSDPAEDDYSLPASVAAASVFAAASAPVFAAPVSNTAAASEKRAEPVVAAAADPLDDDFADMEFAYDPDLDEEMALPVHAAAVQPRPAPRRGMLVAGIVVGVAVLGGIGAFALSYGNGVGSSEPALVKADATPIKVKPENPGGATVPNQDNKVYDTVGGEGTAAPQQEKLVTTAEEPVAMPEEAPLPSMSDEDSAEDATAELGEDTAASAATGTAEAQVTPKGEDRVEQLIEDAGVDNSVEVAAVAPRKVRTMVVKADGTLVARDEPAPVTAVDAMVKSAAAGMAEPETSAAPLPDTATATAIGESADDAAPINAAPPAAKTALPPVAAEPAPAEVAAVEPEAVKPVVRTQSSTTPEKAPLAPARPSDQPVDIVGEVKPQQVASASTSAAATGAWSMQIASQPSEAAAQSSYQDLLRRYGSVLEGRQASIVKAEIANKGTFWRVRVPAGTRADAISLCESYKAVGGNCFVSK